MYVLRELSGFVYCNIEFMINYLSVAEEIPFFNSTYFLKFCGNKIVMNVITMKSMSKFVSVCLVRVKCCTLDPFKKYSGTKIICGKKK